ncbi:hypothetical protein [Paraburkholderia youngii]|uniref:hypothetical protein n=1 Tax=Paraburkholderia youngii TaxID=2782701 RepID=UPI003D24395C
MIQQFFAALVLMFVVPVDTHMSAREIVAKRVVILKRVIIATYATLGLVAYFYAMTWVLAHIFGLAIPETVSLIARVAAFMLPALLAAEMVYDSRYCNEDLVIEHRRKTAW